VIFSKKKIFGKAAKLLTNLLTKASGNNGKTEKQKLFG